MLKMFIEKRLVFICKMLDFVIYTSHRQNWIVTLAHGLDNCYTTCRLPCFLIVLGGLIQSRKL